MIASRKEGEYIAGTRELTMIISACGLILWVIVGLLLVMWIGLSGMNLNLRFMDVRYVLLAYVGLLATAFFVASLPASPVKVVACKEKGSKTVAVTNVQQTALCALSFAKT